MIDKLGRYRIEREIGRGSTGVVYLGYDEELNRRAAIKVLVIPPTVQGAERREMIERFRREARAASAVLHPNIAAIYEVGTDGDNNYIAMEYCEGTTLRDILTMQGPPSESRALDIARQILGALQAAHEAGVCHRDVKPDNVMVSQSGVAKVMDFGIARAVGDINITRAGTMVGTPAYMSPEQILGQPTDHRSDIFSMGILLHEILVGRRPFEGETATQITYAIVNDEPQLSSLLKPEYLAIIKKALSKCPSDRFQSAGEMLQAIEGKVPVNQPDGSGSAAVKSTIVGSPTLTVASGGVQYPAVDPTSLSYAGFWLRVAANLIDAILWFILSLIAQSLILNDLIWNDIRFWYYADNGLMLWKDLIIPLVIGIAYEVLFVAWAGQTIGKKAAGIIVITDNGHIPGIGTALVRYVGWILASLPCMLGILWVAIDPKKQGWHDKLAETYVVKLPRTVGLKTGDAERGFIRAIRVVAVLYVVQLFVNIVFSLAIPNDSRRYTDFRYSRSGEVQTKREYFNESPQARSGFDNRQSRREFSSGSSRPQREDYDSWQNGSRFSILETEGIKEDIFGFSFGYITGVVRNNTNNTYTYVQIEINLYDENGAQVGIAIDVCANLEPYGYWRFRAPVFSEYATQYQVVDIKAF